MPRKGSSQWDFGKLFPVAETRRVLTVAELTAQVRRLIEQQFNTLWVSGEVSNLRAQSSGHAYFTLKDTAAQLNCVLFRNDARGYRHLLEDGRKVLLQGELTVYEPRGQYQFVVKAVELQGVGALQLAFERLKQQLAAEGLFAPERKRPLPRFPRRVGVVTSPTGAALRDVLHVSERRDPALQFILAPCRVQGESAAGEIAAAIARLNGLADSLQLDVILVTRGGGSLEDLWAFNEEAVARAIAASRLPVVSAVGHEIDFTISDFVADVRAATPSAAAEIITEGVFASRDFVIEAPASLAALARSRIERLGENLDGLARRLTRAHPRRRLDDHWQRLDDLLAGLGRAMRTGLTVHRTRWQTLFATWLRVRPALVLERHREVCLQLQLRLAAAARRDFDEKNHQQALLAQRLRLLSPEQVLTRGYSITLDAASGSVVRQPGQVRPGTRLRTRLQGGEIESVVKPDSQR